MPSDGQIYSRAALREGKALAEASRSWREANRSVFRNPSSPESRYHHERRKSLGELLRKGVSFHEARRLVDRGFDQYQDVQRRLERGIVHIGERNPRGPNWVLIGGVAIAAWWLMRRQTPSVPAVTAPLSTGSASGQGAYLGPPAGTPGVRPAPGPGGVFGSVGTY